MVFNLRKDPRGDYPKVPILKQQNGDTTETAEKSLGFVPRTVKVC